MVVVVVVVVVAVVVAVVVYDGPFSPVISLACQDWQTIKAHVFLRKVFHASLFFDKFGHVLCLVIFHWCCHPL